MTQPRPQANRYDSPWSPYLRVRLALWRLLWPLLGAWTPKLLNPWRCLLLRFNGARLGDGVFVHPRARIEQPWNLTMEAGVCIGDRANLYSLGPIRIGARTVIAQEAYLCTGSHAFDEPALPLQVLPIVVGTDCFIGLRAILLPGVTVANRVVVGAGSVVTKPIPVPGRYAGNPAKRLGSGV